MEEDFRLVERFKRGDENAFDELVKRHYQRVCNILYHTGGGSLSIEDLAQDVFVRAYHSLRYYRGESSFSTWLYRIAVNVSLDELRREKRRRIFPFGQRIHRGEGEEEAEASISTYDGADAELEKKEIAEMLQNAMNKIPEKHRVVFVLREVEGFSYGEIAQVLQCSLGTVKSRLFHARMKLRRLLRGYFGSSFE